MSIFIKNAKPDPSAVDPIIEILKIGSMTIFIKNVKPDLWRSELTLEARVEPNLFELYLARRRETEGQLTLMNERQEERLSLPI